MLSTQSKKKNLIANNLDDDNKSPEKKVGEKINFFS